MFLESAEPCLLLHVSLSWEIFFMFHLIIYIAVNVQARAGTEIITLVFILELQGFNALEFVYEIISVQSLDVFMIIMGGYKCFYLRKKC